MKSSQIGAQYDLCRFSRIPFSVQITVIKSISVPDTVCLNQLIVITIFKSSHQIRLLAQLHVAWLNSLSFNSLGPQQGESFLVIVIPFIATDFYPFIYMWLCFLCHFPIQCTENCGSILDQPIHIHNHTTITLSLALYRLSDVINVKAWEMWSIDSQSQVIKIINCHKLASYETNGRKKVC